MAKGEPGEEGDKIGVWGKFLVKFEENGRGAAVMLNSPDLPKATNEEERKRNIEVASKQTSLYNNPCLNEQKLSYKCLENNNYDKDVCAVAFANYKACHEFWNKVTLDRRRNGIRPYLPRVEEREQIKAEYMAKLHGPSKVK